MHSMSSLNGKQFSNLVTADTTSALYSRLLSGRTYRGAYSPDISYAKGDVVLYNDATKGPMLKEAVIAIPSGSDYREDAWALPSVGSPYSETGTVNLVNAQDDPFNDSEITITLKNEMSDNLYALLLAYDAAGVDEVEIYHKRKDGFSMRYWGTAPYLTVAYFVMTKNK